MNTDKAGKYYWDQTWEDKPLPSMANPRAKGLKNHVQQRFDALFHKAFSSLATEDKALLEIGCANSQWLPYFAKEFGFKVNGIDYSEIGCQRAERILSNEGVSGEIECADAFSPPERMQGVFDVVVSLGVVEHFEDTTDCVRAFSKFLKPGGLMVTIVPNMAGVLGRINKAVNRPVFEKHVPLDKEALLAAHESSLEILSSGYLLFASALINIERWRGRSFFKVIARSRSLLSMLLWLAERNSSALSPNRWTSPYVFCIARKPYA